MKKTEKLVSNDFRKFDMNWLLIYNKIIIDSGQHFYSIFYDGEVKILEKRRLFDKIRNSLFKKLFLKKK